MNKHTRSIVVTLLMVIGLAICSNTMARAQEVLPRPEPKFKGYIGRTAAVWGFRFRKEVST